MRDPDLRVARGAEQEGFDQRGLADSRFARYEDHLTFAFHRAFQPAAQLREVGFTANQISWGRDAQSQRHRESSRSCGGGCYRRGALPLLIARFCDRTDEAVAPPVRSFDKARLPGVITKRLA